MFVIYYGCPCSLFIILYGRILLLFKKRQLNRDFAKSKTIDNASKQVTKTIVIVSLCFIIFLGVDNFYLLMVTVGPIDFNINSSTQKITVFLSMLNLCNNPVVYIIAMPTFRHSIRKTFCFERKQNRKWNTINSV